MKTIISLILIVLMFAGCATMPTPEQVAKADYGDYPADYQSAIKQHLSSRLYDPYTAQYSGWSRPFPVYYKPFMSSQILYGYRVCVAVNAKNRMGGYTGDKLHFFLIKNDAVIAHEGGNYRPNTYGEQNVHNLCRQD